MSPRSSRKLDEVRILDASALIRLKSILAVAEQWPLLMRMSGLVESGCLAFPRQVANELKKAKHPDAPGVWAACHKGWGTHPQPRDGSVAEALGAAQLIDPDSEADAEPADPYVVAMALEIKERFSSVKVVVVTEDRVDRMPAKESIVTACQRLELESCTAEEFATWLRAQPQS